MKHLALIFALAVAALPRRPRARPACTPFSRPRKATFTARLYEKETPDTVAELRRAGAGNHRLARSADRKR